MPEFEKALERDPSLLPANLFLGIDYLNLGMSQKATTVLRRALRIDPANREAHRALAASELA